MRIYCMLGGKTILGHFCFWSKGGFSLFSKKNAFLFLFLSPLYGVAVCTFIYTKNQIFEEKKKRGYREIGMLLYLYLDGTKMITFLLACLYVLCQMPATDTAGIALFSTPAPPPFPVLFSWK